VKRIKVGVVGVGFFGRFHAEKYAAMEGVELVGVADVDSSRADEVAQRHRTRSFSDYRNLIDIVEAVSIAVPTCRHHPVAVDFFRQGVDVLLEKPIASTLEEADQLIELAESKDLILQVGQLERFNGALLASQGMIQNPFCVESLRLSPFPGRGVDVDVVLDVMIHDIDILLSLVSSDVRAIHATGKPVVTSQADTADARIEFENGCLAKLKASRVAEEKVRQTRIYQSSGTLTLDYLSQRAFFSPGEAVPEGRNDQSVCQEIPVERVDLLESELDSFIRSVRDRKRVRVSGREGRRALEVALKITGKINEETGN